MWLLPSSQLTSDWSCVNWSTRSHTDGEDGEINLTKIQDWPPHHGVELPAVSIGHQAVELRPLSRAPEMPVSMYSPAICHPRRSQ